MSERDNSIKILGDGSLEKPYFYAGDPTALIDEIAKIAWRKAHKDAVYFKNGDEIFQIKKNIFSTESPHIFEVVLLEESKNQYLDDDVRQSLISYASGKFTLEAFMDLDKRARRWADSLGT